MLKQIATDAYNQFESNLNKLESVSILLKEEKDIIYEIYNKVYNIVNHVIMLDDNLYYSTILTLSSEGITKIDNLVIQ